jgi:hypothetical protein
VFNDVRGEFSPLVLLNEGILQAFIGTRSSLRL